MIGSVISIILWVGVFVETNVITRKKLIIAAPIVTIITISIIIWVSIAGQIDFKRSEEISEIKTITVDGHGTYQVALFSDGDVINVTEKLKRIFQEGTKIKQLKVIDRWAGGICWARGYENKYEIVKE